MTDEVLRVAMKGTIDTQEYRNIFTFRWVDPAGVNSYDSSLLAYFNGCYVNSALLTTLGTKFHLTDYDVYRWSGTNWVLENNFPFVHNGSVAGDILPYQNAPVILGKVPARRGMGRKFLAGVPEANQTDSTVSSALLDALVSFAATYVVQIIDGALTLTPGVFDKNHLFHAFGNAVVDAVIGTQRRRKIGVGA